MIRSDNYATTTTLSSGPQPCSAGATRAGQTIVPVYWKKREQVGLDSCRHICSIERPIPTINLVNLAAVHRGLEVFASISRGGYYMSSRGIRIAAHFSASFEGSKQPILLQDASQFVFF
jgi:hypothetical protein